MIRKTLFVAGAMIAAVAAIPAQAQLAGVKILNISGIYESSMSDSNMTTARGVLTGAGATVTDVAVGSFSAASLTGINIVYVGLVNGSFTASQVSTIQTFVNGGGGLVAVGTERAGFGGSPTFEQLANSFGLYGSGGDRGAAAAPSAPLSPIVTGPFGVATSYQPSATGAFDASRLPAGSTVVWRGDDNTPIIVTLNTTGRAFFFGDTNFMENPYIGNGSNRTIWGNAFAFTGFVGGAVPEPATWGMMILGFGMIGAGMRYRRKATKVGFAA